MWKDDKRNGKGIIKFFSGIYENEGEIEGNWINDILEGESNFKVQFGDFNMTFKGFAKNNLMNGNGILTYLKGKQIYSIFKNVHFEHGKLNINEKMNSELFTITMNEKDKKLKEIQENYKINYYKDEWKANGYNCNSSILHLNTSKIYKYDGFELEPKKDDLRIVLNHLKHFELYFLTKELVIKRENIPIQKLIQEK